MDFETGINEIIKEIKNNPNKLKEEKDTITRYGNLFAYDNIDNITAQQFNDFCNYTNNHHWTLSRGATKISQDMAKLKTSLKILLDENISILDRLKRLRNPQSLDYHKYFGKAYFSVILFVTHPKKYPVYNDTVKKVIYEMGDIIKPTSSPIWEIYPKLQNIIQDIARKYNLTLWQMDKVWYKMLDTKSYEDLLEFIREENTKYKYYQLIILQRFLLSSGVTKKVIEEEIIRYDPTATNKLITNTVLKILQDKNYSIIRNEDDKYLLNILGELTPHQTNALINACKEKIQKLDTANITNFMNDKKNNSEILATPQKYFLLHHKMENNRWDDKFGKIYNYGKISNYKKLRVGSKTIWNTKKDDKYLFFGHGDIKNIKQEQDKFYAEMQNFKKFDSPKLASDKLSAKIRGMPKFHPMHSILPITKEICDEILGKEESDRFKDEKHETEMLNNEKKTIKTIKDKKLSSLSLAEIKQGYAKISKELLIPEEKITEIIIALTSDRHVLLAGPIGTGKTRLAKLIPKIFWNNEGGYYSEEHTATADWNTQDVIGGIYPKMEDGKPIYDIQYGCVVDTVRKNWENGIDGGKRIHYETSSEDTILERPSYRGVWLTIDEFNRADIDKAFGQLFTTLRTKQLKIPTEQKGISYKNLTIPQDYRIIGTLNTADKHFLFQLSDALKSRFAYIEIDIPRKDDWQKEIYYAMKNAIYELDPNNFDSVYLDHENKLIDEEKSNSEFYAIVIQAYNFLDIVRIFKKLGTAVLKLIYQHLITGQIMKINSLKSFDNALTTNLIPQLENIPGTFIEAIYELHSNNLIDYLKKIYNMPNQQENLKIFKKILEYLQISNRTNLLVDFEKKNISLNDEQIWEPIRISHDKKKSSFELNLPQMKKSMIGLMESTVI